MCGIIAYAGTKGAKDMLIDGLEALEYRGYDSSGFYIAKEGSVKSVGRVANLREKAVKAKQGSTGIAHTRWATHGVPSEVNAHPHMGSQKRAYVVHNGIVENYQELKEGLKKSGVIFKSETDTEVIPQLIESYIEKGFDFHQAFLKTLGDIRGTYGLAVMDAFDNEKIYVARMGSPLIIGIADHGRFVASDNSPLARHAHSVVYLNDGDVAIITGNEHEIFSQKGERVLRGEEKMSADVARAEKGEYKHFMEKEIMEGARVVENAIRGRIEIDDGTVKLGGLESVADRLREIDRIIIVGCGTAYYAGLVGEYIIEEYAGVSVEVEIASEFRYRKPVLTPRTALLAVSQSGETADTLEAIREAKRKGILTLGIVNVVGSSIARETDAGIYNHAGPEIGVASTKAFISQVTVLALFAVFLGRQRSMSLVTGRRIGQELMLLPQKIESILSKRDELKKIALAYKDVRDMLVIGRKYNMPIAYEGALKVKEVSYIHAEGYGAGEMKHGPLAMIDEHFPTVAIAPKDSVYEKNISNIQEIRARKGKIFTIATEGDSVIGEVSNDVFYIPHTIEALTPILSVVPLQLFAYYIADAKGLDVDKPKNLAKSVTVE
jgi:glucosamine--fructose-6-phosphate aminotransferase (isomerizing)